MDELDPRQSVGFEQVVAPGRRRRRLDPLVIGSILVAFGVFIGVAWPDAPSPPTPTTEARATAGPTSAVPPPTPSQVPGIDAVGTTMAESIAVGLQNLGAWGVRTYALVDGAIERRWQPVAPGEGAVAPLVVVDSPSIVLIEVTSPPDLAPLDVRVWARGYVGHWDWIDTGWPASGALAGRVLLRPPVVERQWLPAWPAGRYRVDLLLGERVARLDLTIDRDAPTLDAPISEWNVPSERREPTWAVDPPAGPFVIDRGVGLPLHAAASGALDIAGGWLAPDVAVAREWIPAATGLGVVLPAGARDPQVELRRLVPEEVFVAPEPVVWSLGRPEDAPDLAVRFDARPRDRMDPGVYAIDASWSGPPGPDAATWTIELLPAPAAAAPVLLDAARLAADLAGVDGVVRDASFGAGHANRWIEPLTEPGTCDPESAAPVVALVVAEPPDGIVEDVRIDAPALPLPFRGLRLVRPAAGITIAYPERSFAFPPGDYAVEIDGSHPRTLRFCVTGGPIG